MLACAPRDGPRSVLLVTLDTTRADFVSHLGGADYISAVETGLCERLAGIHTLCREYETDHAAGREIDVDKYLAAASRYDRLAKTVGLHRVARDITPDLRDFMDAKPESPS